MDIKCPKCGQAWEMDCLHEEAARRIDEENTYVDGKPAYQRAEYDGTYQKIRKEFFKDGCSALGGKCSETNKAHPGVAQIYDLLGDDLDGAAAMLDDMEYLGMLDDEEGL